MLVFVMCLYLWIDQPCICHQPTIGFQIIELLRVDVGTGVSFIDLWNMNGVSTGTVSDPIYRHGAIDNEIKFECPSRIYFKFESSNYQIEYRGTYSNLSLTSWLTTVPYKIQDNVVVTTVTLSLKPDDDIPFQMAETANLNNLFLAVHIPTKSAPYPVYYSATSATPVPGPITDPSVQSQFDANTVLTIEARYEDGAMCDITDHNPNVPYGSLGVTTAAATTATTTDPDTTTDPPDTTPALPDTSTLIPDTTASLTDINTMAGSATNATTSVAMCPCDCGFRKRLDVLSTESSIPIAELEIILAPLLEEIKKNLSVDVSKLSATIRKKQSAADKRPSASQMGVLGIILLTVIFGLLLLVDITSIPQHIAMWKQQGSAKKTTG